MPKRKKTQTNSDKSKPKLERAKTHPWRLCPPGEHWRRTHPLRVPPSERRQQGSVTTRHGHCVDNPSRRDQFYPDEIQEVASRNFSKMKRQPCPIGLGFRSKGSRYDELIAGWVQYWNEVFKPKDPLDPNLVKALIASESGFEPNRLANKRDSNSARGLTQITNKSRKILQDEKGELRTELMQRFSQYLEKLEKCAK